MTVVERREAILKLLSTSAGSIKTSELASYLNVTTETIRKDLVYLDKKKLVKKFHGGAKPMSEFVERSLGMRLAESTTYKREIANEAMNVIADSSVIFIDAGSTTCEFAKVLAERATMQEFFSHLAVVTNSFAAADALVGRVHTLYFLGGEVSSTTLSTGGFWAVTDLSSIKLDVAFLGTSGFFSRNGPCSKIGADALFKAEIVKNANRSIVLADHTKFTTTAIMQYTSWEDIDLLITDSNASEELLNSLEESVSVMIADPALPQEKHSFEPSPDLN